MKQEYQNGNMLLPLSNFHVPIPRKPTPYFHLTPKKILRTHIQSYKFQPHTPFHPFPSYEATTQLPPNLKGAPTHTPTHSQESIKGRANQEYSPFDRQLQLRKHQKLNRYRAVKIFLILHAVEIEIF